MFRGETLSDDWREIIALAGRLDGQLRHLAQHCGGLVVVPDEIRRYVPVEVSAAGRPLIQWEKDQAEAARLVKIDLLGNRSLAVIRYALAAVARHVTLAGWWVTGKPIRTGEGKSMEFVTFEDESAVFDATLFPAVYDRFCRKLAQARPYLVKGRVEEEFGVATLNVFWLGFLDGDWAAGRVHLQHRQVL